MLAQEEARRLGHNFVSTEQILLGLIGEGTGIASKTLKSMGVNLKDARVEVEQIIGRGPGFVAVEIPFTAQVKRVLELSWDEARQLGHNYIGTEHLLLGLIRETEGQGDGQAEGADKNVATMVLEELGVDLKKMRKQVIGLLGEIGAAEAACATSVGTRRSKTPMLDAFSLNLTEAAKEDKLDPPVGREEEIELVIHTLARCIRNNPVLVGEPGISKLVIAEGLAVRIADSDVPDFLSDKKIFVLDVSRLIAVSKDTSQPVAQLLKKILDEIRAAGDFLLVIDELHTLASAGAAEGAIDAISILKSALVLGELQCIGVTSMNDYRKYIEQDATLERLFQPVIINPPSVDKTIEILQKLRPKYEEHHRLTISDEAIEQAAKLADRYLNNRYLPDKAMDLIDEASSRVRVRASSLPPKLKEMERALRELRRHKETAIRNQKFEQAASLREEETKLSEEIRQVQTDWKIEQELKKATVNAEEVAYVVSSWTGIPAEFLQEWK